MLLPANLFVYGVNDLADGDTDIFNKKKKGYESQVTDRDLLVQWIAITQAPWLLSLLFVPQQALPFFIVFFLLSFFYSTKPIRAKAMPFIDSWFNLLYVLPGFFIAAFSSSFVLHLPVLLAVWAWCIAMHAYSAIPDIKADSQAGLKTTATVLGKQGTILYCGLFWFLAAVLADATLSFLSYLLFIPYFIMLVRTQEATTHENMLALYKQFPLINGIVGMIIFFSVFL